MPTSVLLAVLAAAGLLALAPALVRRYDATERLEAARAQSTARVLPRTRRPRTVPGRRPVNPPKYVLVPTLRSASFQLPTGAGTVTASIPETPSDSSEAPAVAPEPDPRVESRTVSGPAQGGEPAQRGSRLPQRTRRVRAQERPGDRRARRLAAVLPRSAPPVRRPARPRHSLAVYRRRRVLAALVLLNVVKLVGVVAVGPGFWVGFAVTATLLLAFLVYLRSLALADQRRRRAERRRAAWLAAQQAQVRREQDRRAAARRLAARRMAEQRERLRRSGDWSAPPTVSYRRATGTDGP